ncbi:MAG: glucose-1-phosphate thymidylyltransferase [Candidatus Woykebacteria bacterium]
MVNLTEFIDTDKLYFKGLFENLEHPWDALSQIEKFVEENGQRLEGFKEISEGVYADENVKIDSSAKIIGPALIGNGTKVGQGVLIRDGAIIGVNSRVLHGSEVKHSIVGNSTNLSHFNYAGDSVVGSDVNLAAGAVLANYKNGAADLEIKVEVEGKKVGTGLEKFGAIVGDGVKLGCNVVTDPGTFVGKNTLVYPLAAIRGNIPANKIVKYKPQLEIVDKN